MPLSSVPTPQEVYDRLPAELASLLTDIGLASSFNLVAAVQASHIDGVSGELVIKIPKKTRDHIEVEWRGKSDD